MSSDFGNNGNFTWWNTTDTTASTGNILFSGTVNAAYDTNWGQVKVPEKDWMPYPYFEYEPKWHIKYANYKNQMEHMWD